MKPLTRTQPGTIPVKVQVLQKLLEFSEALLQGDFTKRVITDFNEDIIAKILDNFNRFADKMQINPQGSYNQEETVNKFIEVISSYTNLDFKQKLPISEDGTIFDAIATGINMLGDELAQSTASRYDLEKERNLLEEAKKQAEQANMAKGMFLANMSHEIRTPLNGILGLAQIMLSEQTSEEHRKYLQMIHDAGKNLSQLINDILDFSKIDSGRLELESMPFNFSKVVTAEIERYEFLARQKGLSLFCQVDDNIPKTVVGDQFRICQIITNIVGNSIKFTDEGGIGVRFLLTESSAGKAVIQGVVTDTGVGISKEAQNRIFQSFSQVDNSVTRKYGGTGLGLSIVKSLVEKMNGNISLESPADPITNRGSEFTFSFELSVPEQPVEKGYVEQESTTLRQQTRVLIVDDNAINLLVARKMAEKFGAEVTTADSGTAAIDLVRSAEFDLVFMDIQMPDLDGHETARKLRELNFTKPIVALSASAYKEDIQKSLDSGMNDHLQKPFTETELFEAISRVTIT